MHKDFYASGFLYHPSSQQILLQQYKDEATNSLTWSIFGGLLQEHESYKTAFVRIMYISIRKKLTEGSIYDVYDYYNKYLGKDNSVMYGQLTELEDFASQENVTFTWVNINNIYKLPLSEQVKQDITVGQRVILANERYLSEN